MNNSNVTAKTNLVDTVAAQGSFNIFSKALIAAGLTDTLKGAGPYTVFAPTDAAFRKLPADKLDNWLKPENKEELISVLKHHVTLGRVSGSEVAKLKEAKTVQGDSASFKMVGDRVTIDGANVDLDDIPSSNGVIHAIDEVLMPTRH